MPCYLSILKCRALYEGDAHPEPLLVHVLTQVRYEQTCCGYRLPDLLASALAQPVRGDRQPLRLQPSNLHPLLRRCFVKIREKPCEVPDKSTVRRSQRRRHGAGAGRLLLASCASNRCLPAALPACP
jgi:hypothetical protein